MSSSLSLSLPETVDTHAQTRSLSILSINWSFIAWRDCWVTKRQQCATHNGRSWRQTLTNCSPCWHALSKLRTLGQKVSWTGLTMLRVSCPTLKSADRLFLQWRYYITVLFDASYKVIEFSVIGIKCQRPEMIFSIPQWSNSSWIKFLEALQT